MAESKTIEISSGKNSHEAWIIFLKEADIEPKQCQLVAQQFVTAAVRLKHLPNMAKEEWPAELKQGDIRELVDLANKKLQKFNNSTDITSVPVSDEHTSFDVLGQNRLYDYCDSEDDIESTKKKQVEVVVSGDYNNEKVIISGDYSNNYDTYPDEKLPIASTVTTTTTSIILPDPNNRYDNSDQSDEDDSRHSEKKKPVVSIGTPEYGYYDEDDDYDGESTDGESSDSPSNIESIIQKIITHRSFVDWEGVERIAKAKGACRLFQPFRFAIICQEEQLKKKKGIFKRYVLIYSLPAKPEDLQTLQSNEKYRVNVDAQILKEEKIIISAKGMKLSGYRDHYYSTVDEMIANHKDYRKKLMPFHTRQEANDYIKGLKSGSFVLRFSKKIGIGHIVLSSVKYFPDRPHRSVFKHRIISVTLDRAGIIRLVEVDAQSGERGFKGIYTACKAILGMYTPSNPSECTKNTPKDVAPQRTNEQRKKDYNNVRGNMYQECYTYVNELDDNKYVDT